MREITELRGALALGRGLVAAGAAAVMLFPSGSRAAAPASVAWTKTWAERQLRIHFDATTVACLPLGTATHAKGSSAFKEFVCGLVLSDGTRVTIHLRPRTRTAWTTVSMKRLPPSPDKKGRGGGGAPPGQTVQDDQHAQGKGKNA
jgi:hypothetical protein